MAQEESETQKMWSIFLQTCKATIKKGKNEKGEEVEQIMVEDTLAYDAISYIVRQFNEVTLEGAVNSVQAAKIMRDASDGFFIQIFYKNYDGDILEKEPLLLSGNNLIRLLCSKIVGSGYRTFKVNMKAVSVAPQQIVMGVPTR